MILQGGPSGQFLWNGQSSWQSIPARLQSLVHSKSFVSFNDKPRYISKIIRLYIWEQPPQNSLHKKKRNFIEKSDIAFIHLVLDSIMNDERSYNMIFHILTSEK